MISFKNLILEDEYKTKNGSELDFKFQENVEDRLNKGFIVHRLDAYLEPQSEAFSSGEKVGYIKVSYIPSEDFEDYYPTIFHYLSNAKGKHFLEQSHNVKDIGELKSDKEFAKKAHTSARSDLGINRLKDFPDYREYDEVSDERWKELADYYKEQYREVYKDEFERYKNYHVDKPIVDYIKVKKKQRRKGIGFNLYKKMAKILGDRGMCLFASGVQSEYAEKAWEKLKEVLPVRTVTMKSPSGENVKRYCIDYS